MDEAAAVRPSTRIGSAPTGLEVTVPVHDAGTAELVRQVSETVLNAVSPLDEAAKAELLGLGGAEQLAALLLRDSASGSRRLDDATLRARVRGAGIVEQLLASQGGCLDSTSAAERLGVSRQALSKRRMAGTVLGVPRGNRFIYPAWQFDGGSTLHGLGRVLAALPESPWSRLRFFVAPHDALGGKSPLQRLREGHVEELIALATIELEHVSA